MYTAIQNNPIQVNLLVSAKDTGWTVDGSIATHVSCNSGNVILNAYPVVAGQAYLVSYIVLNISGGYVQLQSPGSNGAHQTTADIYVGTINPTSNGFVSFFSNANCQLQSFNIQNSTVQTGTTLVFSAKNSKWSDNRTYYPDFGVSLYRNSYLFYKGAMYNLLNGSGNTNNFFGVQYPSIIQFVSNNMPQISKFFQSLSIQCNELMITGDNGITTSLGQVSELAPIDFIKDYLSDGLSNYNVETIEGVYAAGFLRDKNTGTVQNGDQLKGNWIIITLISTVTTPLLLYSVNVVAKHSAIGSR